MFVVGTGMQLQVPIHFRQRFYVNYGGLCD